MTTDANKPDAETLARWRASHGPCLNEDRCSRCGMTGLEMIRKPAPCKGLN